ncbi:hypothetical protein Mal4_00550 [Maioricimonas rarisocia]|uniref:Uncharacterized protein n=1 Tax=Maioricimonas rarisocia TaxID=2528026 RepID=A0A517Z012_9PLAN|nr:hypothetical protein Mal4_00550 [Maioricimonas rarisocia]
MTVRRPGGGKRESCRGGGSGVRWVAGVGTSGASGAPGTVVPQDDVYCRRRHGVTEEAGCDGWPWLERAMRAKLP